MPRESSQLITIEVTIRTWPLAYKGPSVVGHTTASKWPELRKFRNNSFKARLLAITRITELGTFIAMYSYRSIFLTVFVILCLAYLLLTSVIYYRATSLKEPKNEQWLRRPELTQDATKSTDLTVLGRALERVDVPAEVGDIFISIKTTSKNHETRLPHIFLTWLMAVWPGQVTHSLKIVTCHVLLTCHVKYNKEIGVVQTLSRPFQL